MNTLIKSLVVIFCLSLCSLPCFAACPSMDFTGDCIVDFEDFALFAEQWLTTDPCVPDDLVYISDGTFQMGDSFGEGFSDELPVHTVTLSSFAMGKYDITNQNYCDFLNSNIANLQVISGTVVDSNNNGYAYCQTSAWPSGHSLIDYNSVSKEFTVLTSGGRSAANDPMVYVTWVGAAAYCNWRSQQEGKPQCYNASDPNWPCDFTKHGYHLPTEAQWEYAARGGISGQRFPWGDTISQTQANFYSESSFSYDVSPVKNQYHPLWHGGAYTSPVSFFNGTLKYKSDYNWPGSDSIYQTTSGANNYGLHDMAGNVWQWCNDWYGSYSSDSQTNPTGPTSGTYRVLRGSAWNGGPYQSRVSYRNNCRDQWFRDWSLGFRIVLDLN